MDDLIKLGKKRTILVSISILLVSLHTIYFYQTVRPEIEPAKLVQQAFRFLLTTGLLWMTYKGKNWAKIVAVVLFSFGMFGAVYGLSEMVGPMEIKNPFCGDDPRVFNCSFSFWNFEKFQSFLPLAEAENGELVPDIFSLKSPASIAKLICW